MVPDETIIDRLALARSLSLTVLDQVLAPKKHMKPTRKHAGKGTRLMRLSLGVVFVLVLGIAGLGCEKSNRNNSSLLASHTAAVTFPPHPGKIVFRSAWDHGEKTVSAKEMPDTNKFIFYGIDGSETSDAEHAAKRVPIVEVNMVSVDKDGKLVAPKNAVLITITEYGADHHELRHTAGHPPPHP